MGAETLSERSGALWAREARGTTPPAAGRCMHTSHWPGVNASEARAQYREHTKKNEDEKSGVILRRLRPRPMEFEL